MVGRNRDKPEQPDDDESSLIEAAKSDPHAFAPLYQRYFDPVYRYAYYRLGNPERAADATSQVFVRALAALPNYRAGSFRGWIFSIAHNVVVDTGPARNPSIRCRKNGICPIPARRRRRQRSTATTNARSAASSPNSPPSNARWWSFGWPV